MVISDAHEGLKAAARKVLGAGYQRCRVHFQRNLLARVGKANKPVVSAVVKTVFAETDRDRAHARWREVADNLRDRFRDVAELMDGAEHEVLAYMAFDESLRAKLHSTNPLERVNKEIKRRTNVVGLGGQSVHWTACLSASLPNRDAVVRLVGAFAMDLGPMAASWRTVGAE